MYGYCGGDDPELADLFERNDYWRVAPGLFSNDVVAACDREAVDLSAAQDACEYHRERSTGGSQDDMGRTYTQAECEQLASALNELYGIDEP